MDENVRHAAVVDSLKTTASELQARPSEEMNRDWADRMADGLAAAGLLAVPAALPVVRRWRDQSGDVWQEVVAAPMLQLVVYAEGEPAFGGVFQAFQHVADKWGPLVPVEIEDHASPAAPADDEATVKKAVYAMLATPHSVRLLGNSWKTSELNELMSGMARAALAALREGQQ